MRILQRSETAMDPRREEPGNCYEPEIRLFQDTLEALLLQGIPAEVADAVRPRAEREWLEDLSILTGLPSAMGMVVGGSDRATEPPPSLTFAPTTKGLAELREAHREARRDLMRATTSTAAADARHVLAVLAAIARALRDAGLWPSYAAVVRAIYAGRKP